MIRLDDSCQLTRLLSDDNYVCVNVRFFFAMRFPRGYVDRVRSCRCRRRLRSHRRRVVVVVKNSHVIDRFLVNYWHVKLEAYFAIFWFVTSTSRYSFVQHTWLSWLFVFRFNSLLRRIIMTLERSVRCSFYNTCTKYIDVFQIWKRIPCKQVYLKEFISLTSLRRWSDIHISISAQWLHTHSLPRRWQRRDNTKATSPWWHAHMLRRRPPKLSRGIEGFAEYQQSKVYLRRGDAKLRIISTFLDRKNSEIKI